MERLPGTTGQKAEGTGRRRVTGAGWRKVPAEGKVLANERVPDGVVREAAWSLALQEGLPEKVIQFGEGSS